MTRVRILTPAGAAAVAVLALEARPGSAVGLADGAGNALDWPGPGRFRRARLQIGGRFVDDVLVVGKDLGLELHVHGGTAVVRAVIDGLADGREADRAPEAGPAPSCLRAARARASGLHGRLRGIVEAEDGGSELGPGDDLRTAIHEVIARVPLARRLEQPATVRLVGAPNAGKSTLFNALLQEDRSLVSPEAGTTRDTVSALTQWWGVPVRLEDTEGGTEAEFRRPGADLLVEILSSVGQRPPRDRAPGVALIRVAGKADQCSAGGRPGVSGRSGAGVPALRARILAALGACGSAQDDVLVPLDPDLRRHLRRTLAGLLSGSVVSGSSDALRRGGYGLKRVR